MAICSCICQMISQCGYVVLWYQCCYTYFNAQSLGKVRLKIPNAGSENDKTLLSYQLYVTAGHHSHECEDVNF